MDFKDIRFTFTPKMKEIMIEMLFTQQMVDDEMYDTELQKRLLIKHHNELGEDLSKEFKKHNQKQIKQFDNIMDDLEQIK